MSLNWKIDECSLYQSHLRVRGWCFHTTQPIRRLYLNFLTGESVEIFALGLPSPDVALVHGSIASDCRFDDTVRIRADSFGKDFNLRVIFADNTEFLTSSCLENANLGDPYHAIWQAFRTQVSNFKEGKVLEIGSRARSAISRRHLIDDRFEYIGFDILQGPNVDVCGDAHELSRYFAENTFIAIFSCSVFEHLAMPWKVVLEMNKVLKPGAIVMTQTHQTWPVHEEPWDFWRYSKYSWYALFNSATGFEVIDASVGEPASIISHRANPVTWALPNQPAFLGSCSMARKLSNTKLEIGRAHV